MKQKLKTQVVIPQKYLKKIVKVGDPQTRKAKPVILRTAGFNSFGAKQIVTQSDLMRPLKKAIKNVIKKNPIMEIRDGSTSPEIKYDDIIEALS